ncbi:MAG: hypothetical protein HXS51_13625, partial [Theionarchaea archaeon]|nr:hypothetical protein [Theionarchaea archaeon]
AGATVPLDLPEKKEVGRILYRVLRLYARARELTFSEAEIREIKQEYSKTMSSALPRDIILYALEEGDKKWEFTQGHERIREALEAASTKIIQESDVIRLGKRFEEAVGVLLAYVPGGEFPISQPDATDEGNQLRSQVTGLGGFQKCIDWLLRKDGKDVWIEVCITKRRDSTLPSKKALAVLAKTLYNDGSFGLFVTHNYERFPAGGKITKTILKFRGLEKRVHLMNLDEEEFGLLIGIVGIDQEDRYHAARFFFEKTGFVRETEKLINGEYPLFGTSWISQHRFS